MGEETQHNPGVPQPPTDPTVPPQPNPEADPSRTEEEGERYDGGEIPQVDPDRPSDEDEVA